MSICSAIIVLMKKIHESTQEQDQEFNKAKVAYVLYIAKRIFKKVPNASRRDVLSVALSELPFDRHPELSKRILDVGKTCISDKELKSLEAKIKSSSESSEDWSDYISAVSREILPLSPKSSSKIVTTCFEFAETFFPSQKRNSFLTEKLTELEKHFSISDLDKELLKIFYAKEIMSDFSDLLGSRSVGMDSIRRSADKFAAVLSSSRHQIVNSINSSSRLNRMGLITSERNCDYSISSLLVEFLSGNLKGTLADEFFEKFTSLPNVSSKQSSISTDCLKVLRCLLQSNGPQNILFYGDPGTGKTVLARSIGLELGMPVYGVKQINSNGEGSLKERRASLISAQKILPESALLIVDECDPILNTDNLFITFGAEGSDGKNWINHYLERSKLKIIWIVNHTYRIDESTKRRFSLAVEFDKPGPFQRKYALKTQKKVTNSSFLRESELERIAQQYNVSPGIIALALKNVSELSQIKSRSEKIRLLDVILKRQEHFLDQSPSPLAPKTSSYDLESLNTDIPLPQIVTSAKRFLNNKGGLEITNFNLLLSGPPGTGKTEFAKYLAESLRKELIVKRASDLLSKWLGESEKNIRKAYMEAQERNAVLFLDEADSLFINRTKAEKSWEISQTNELLCQMENFRGVALYATNFQQNLDQAIVRRLIYKVEFRYLSGTGVVRQFENSFSKLLDQPLNDTQRQKLAKIGNLTPGDFKVARQRFLLGEAFSFDAALTVLLAESKAKLDGSGKPKLGLHSQLTYLN